MGAMDLLVNEVGSRFGMTGDRAGSLLTALLSLIQEQSGGLNGFLEKFRRAGLSDSVSGWLSGSTPTAINAESLQNVLGSQTVNNIASRVGVPASTAAGAL